MNPTNKGMASSLNNSLNYRHSGRTWKTTPFNILKDVQITTPSNTKFWQHLVFSLDKIYLRNSAIGFDQFREETKGKAMLKVFAFSFSCVIPYARKVWIRSDRTVRCS